MNVDWLIAETNGKQLYESRGLQSTLTSGAADGLNASLYK